MVLMLELVSIGVFGACLSALLCMMTEGTPYEVPKVISFKKGLLRPRIIRSVNWPKWKIGNVHEDEEIRKNVYHSQHKSQKRQTEVRKNYGRFVQTSISNLKSYTERTVPKTTSNVKKYLEEEVVLPASPSAIVKSCKYCGNAEIWTAKSNELKDRSLIAKSVSRLKSTLGNRKIDDDSCAECSRLYDGKWRKVRTKKRRFILPKSLGIAKKPDNVDADKAGLFVDSLDKQLQLNGRYCYLEALRIKTNKAETSV